MKVVIIGINSYIGEHIKMHLQKYGHIVTELDAIGDAYKEYDFTGIDAVIHVAAIVHEKAKTASELMFYQVNTQLPIAVANRAKEFGVRLFVFMSTMAVYGSDKSLPKGNVITAETPLRPSTLYGKSKLEAEKGLLNLMDKDFKVAVVRPPNVYGKNCKGNYMEGFKKLATKLPLFPKAFLQSRQSMVYIDNLSELIRLILISEKTGIYTPQDDVIPNSCDLVEMIAKSLKRKTRRSALVGVIISPFGFIPIVKKIFGGVSYSTELSNSFNNAYQIVSFQDGMIRTFAD